MSWYNPAVLKKAKTKTKQKSSGFKQIIYMKDKVIAQAKPDIARYV